MLRTGATLEVIPPPVLPKSLRSSNFSFLYFLVIKICCYRHLRSCVEPVLDLKCFISFCGKERDKKKKIHACKEGSVYAFVLLIRIFDSCLCMGNGWFGKTI